MGRLKDCVSNFRERRSGRSYSSCEATLPAADSCSVESSGSTATDFSSAALPVGTSSSANSLDQKCVEVADALHRSKYGKEGATFYFADGKIYDSNGECKGSAFLIPSDDPSLRRAELGSLKNADYITTLVKANIDGQEVTIDGKEVTIAIGPPPGTVPTYVASSRFTRFTGSCGQDVDTDRMAVTEVVYSKASAATPPPQSGDFTQIGTTASGMKLVQHRDGRIARINGDRLEWKIYEPTNETRNGERTYGGAFWAADPSYNTAIKPAAVDVSPLPQASKVETKPEVRKEAGLPEPLPPPVLPLPEKGKAEEKKTESAPDLAAVTKIRQDEADKLAREFSDRAVDAGSLVAPSTKDADGFAKVEINGVKIWYKADSVSGAVEYRFQDINEAGRRNAARYPDVQLPAPSDAAYGERKANQAAKDILNDFLFKLDDLNWNKSPSATAAAPETKFPESVTIDSVDKGEKFLKDAAKYFNRQGLAVHVFRTPQNGNAVLVQLGSGTVIYTFDPKNSSWSCSGTAAKLFSHKESDKLSAEERKTQEAFQQIEKAFGAKLTPAVTAKLDKPVDRVSAAGSEKLVSYEQREKELSKLVDEFLVDDAKKSWVGFDDIQWDKRSSAGYVLAWDSKWMLDPTASRNYYRIENRGGQPTICWSTIKDRAYSPVTSDLWPAGATDYSSERLTDVFKKLRQIQEEFNKKYRSY